MKHLITQGVLGVLTLSIVVISVSSWTSSAARRADAVRSVGEGQKVAVAAVADEGYCSAELKVILRRVLTSCGLIKEGQVSRGCEPLQAKNVAAMSGADFNALFRPLADRAAIIQFDQGKTELDASAIDFLDRTFSDQRGASYFFVVSRASPDGSTETNRTLSEGRANAVLAHLRQRFNDPDLDKEVGLLWLGEEFAQLEDEYCGWKRSRGDQPCSAAELNRSAFIAWIDCRL
ncbi:MAG: hypothetical protein MUC50_00840 [Myxococcota bacterium]|jgi:hypothetical protein|nr:hypothetical protein [Myxococcota bacterium]